MSFTEDEMLDSYLDLITKSEGEGRTLVYDDDNRKLVTVNASDGADPVTILDRVPPALGHLVEASGWYVPLIINELRNLKRDYEALSQERDSLVDELREVAS